MGAGNDRRRKRFILSKDRYVVGCALLVVSAVVTFTIGRERQMVSLEIKSLCLSLLGLLLYGATLAVKAQVDEFKKTRHWAEIFVATLYVLVIVFYLLLIGLILKAFGIA